MAFDPITNNLATDLIEELDDDLRDADSLLAGRYPGDSTAAEPLHTVYVPGDVFAASTVADWGREALDLIGEFAPNPATLAQAVGEPEAEVAAVYDRIVATLSSTPIQDLRIDFEDGYGTRSDADEDAAIAKAVASLRDSSLQPRWLGIRFKSFEAPSRARGVRTLVAFLSALHASAGIGSNLRLTLPKVTSVEQVAAMVKVCERVEAALGLPVDTLRFEIQVETAQAIMSETGTAPLAAMLSAGGPRVSGLHYGTFDYSAGMGVAAAYQSLEHPVADHAKAVMQLAAAQTGVRISDGSTNVVAFHDRSSAHATWQLHHRLVTRSLTRAIYQGWDMHPGHLPTRYLANFLFFQRAQPAATARLAAYLSRTGGEVMDEPATAKMLAMALLRGVHCGAIDLETVSAATGLDQDGLTHLVATGKAD